MSEPYRDMGNACPGCGAAMRPFGERMVCDGCGGMFLAVADLARSINEASPPVVELAGDTATDKACPRCQRRLVSAQAKIPGRWRARRQVLSCPADGVFILPEDLAALLRHAAPRRADGGEEGGVRNGNLAADRVGLFRRRPPTTSPAERVAWESAHRDQRLPCPVCGIALFLDGERWACGKCAGLFVEPEPLGAMMTEMTFEVWEPPAPGAATDRKCPVCATAMGATRVEEIPVEQCEAHGFWFDANELGDALAAAGGATAKRGWIARLLGR